MCGGVGGGRMADGGCVWGGADVWCRRRFEGCRCVSDIGGGGMCRGWRVMWVIGFYEVLEGYVKCVVMQDWWWRVRCYWIESGVWNVVGVWDVGGGDCK